MTEIEDYVRANRSRYTRPAITERLEAAGHRREEIDATWERLERDEPIVADAHRPLGRYAWAVYWLGGALIVLAMVIAVVNNSVGFLTFGAAWLVAYLALAALPIRAIARTRATSLGTTVLLIVAAPLAVLLIGGGICYGTIFFIASTLY